MSFDEILDAVENLSLENQEIFLDIVNKRFAEKHRQNFIEETVQAKQEYEIGNYSFGDSNDLFKTLGI